MPSFLNAVVRTHARAHTHSTDCAFCTPHPRWKECRAYRHGDVALLITARGMRKQAGSRQSLASHPGEPVRNYRVRFSGASFHLLENLIVLSYFRSLFVSFFFPLFCITMCSLTCGLLNTIGAKGCSISDVFLFFFTSAVLTIA